MPESDHQTDGPSARNGMYRVPMSFRLSLYMFACVLMAISAHAVIRKLVVTHEGYAWLLASLICMPLCWLAARVYLSPILQMYRTMAGTLNSYQDRDFSWSLNWPHNDEQGDLVDAHNALANVLRAQRLDLVQRELLLDTMVQQTPVAMMLLDSRRHVVFSNVAARKLLNEGRRLEGDDFDMVLLHSDSALRDAFHQGGDCIFVVKNEDDEDVYNLARRSFSLNGRQHELLLIRHLTAELRRQEVQTWKKVIRVISHELNNTLGPITSLANSGHELARRASYERLPEVFATIADRSRHLHEFLDAYAQFAKLPVPRRQALDWAAFVEGLGMQATFKLARELPTAPAMLDAAQIETALVNLIKNAHESGSPADQVELSILSTTDSLRIEVSDRGPGMSENVMANALVPFYSTKRSGTGLGLALAREIAEAHGGRINLQNRSGGGLKVSLILPRAASQPAG